VKLNGKRRKRSEKRRRQRKKRRPLSALDNISLRFLALFPPSPVA
jgi:hypothetical protein